MNTTDFDDPSFLEPAHRHDPAQVSHITELPSAILNELTEDTRKSIVAVQESTSVVQASLKRLTNLENERFYRLLPAKNQSSEVESVQYSEPAFFTYVSQLRSEKTYFFEEALPDWNHKAMRVTFDGSMCVESITGDSESTLVDWLKVLRDTVDDWADDAEDVVLPDFEETVAEYRVFQDKEIRKSDARNARNRRRTTMLGLERPDPKELELQKTDSGVVMSDVVSD